MKVNPKRELDDIEIDKKDQTEKKTGKCFAICLIILIIMMLPSTIALLAIF